MQSTAYSMIDVEEIALKNSGKCFSEVGRYSMVKYDVYDEFMKHAVSVL